MAMIKEIPKYRYSSPESLLQTSRHHRTTQDDINHYGATHLRLLP
jgi:hypothetical protein